MGLKTFIIKNLRKIKKRKKKILINLILLFFALLLCFGIFELALRLFFPQPWNYYRQSEELSWELIPNVKTTHNSSGRLIYMDINSKGLRDDNSDYEKPLGIYRILVLGDSFTEGQGIQKEEIYSELLEKKLGQGYEVITAGIKAYGTAQELAFLKKEGLKYNPDLVIVGFYVGNDVRDNAVNQLYSTSNGVLIKNNPKTSYSKKLLNEIKSFLNSRVRSYVFIRPRLGLTLNNILIKSGFASKNALAEITEDDKLILDTEIFFKSPSEKTKKGWKIAKELLKEMKHITEVNNIKLVVFLIPSREQVDNLEFSKFIRTYNLTEKDLDLFNPQKRMVELCKEIEVPVIDPLEDFRHQNRNNTFYFDDDIHWNIGGHKLASEELYKALKNKNLLP